MIEVRPRRLTAVCRSAAVAVIVVFGLISLVLPAGSSGGKRFGLADQLLFFATGLALALGVLALTRPRVWADATGIRVRNVLGERSFPWGVVAAVGLAEGASWAQLELHDDQTVALLAIQSNDGAQAKSDAHALAALRDAALGPG